MQPPVPPLPAVQVTVFDIKLRRTSTKGRVHVECLPPEEVFISPRARESTKNVPFVMVKTETPRSELIEDGFERDTVDALPTGRPNWLEIDALARNQVVDQLSVENPADRSMQTVEVRNTTLMVDQDGDGIAELRQILVAGDKILDNEEIEECPIASCSPIRMPHRHTGLSYYDLIADLQVIKTTLFRQGLDNLYLANNIRMGVDWKNCSIDDLLTSRPGGVVRTNGPPGQVLMPIEQESNLVSQVMPALEYVDQLKANRTGLGKGMAGLDADELQNVTKGGQLAAMSAASLKVELVARLLAEGVKEIFTKIHGCLIRHQDQPLQFELAGQWVSVNPSEWRRRTRVNVNVGLGSGNREEMRANLQMLAQAQMPLAQLGLVGPKQAYATFSAMAEALGFNQPNLYAMDPDSPEYAQHQAMMAAQPPPPNPAVQVANIKAQSTAAAEQAKSQRELLKMQGQLNEAQLDAKIAQDKATGEIAHAAMQSHMDQQSSQHAEHSAMAQTLIKVIGSIVAQQLKGQQANAGLVLKQDFESAKSLESE
jgi:hypothetical protein